MSERKERRNREREKEEETERNRERKESRLFLAREKIGPTLFYYSTTILVARLFFRLRII